MGPLLKCPVLYRVHGSVRPRIIVTDIYVYMDKADLGSNEHCYAAVWDHAAVTSWAMASLGQ